jgi:hypothetical protein
MKGHTITRALSALGLATVAVAVSLAQPTQLAFWDFNESNPLDSTAMLAADGGVFASQAQIAINLAGFRFDNNGRGFLGSPLDPGTDGRNWALQTTDYPAQGQDSGLAGIVVSVPTTGYQNIVVKFDVRWSNTASKFLAVEYTTDGGVTWTRRQVLQALRGDSWHGNTNASGGYGALVELDLSADSAVNNNAQFAFRVVTIFDPETNQYTAAQSGSNYTTRGTLRYDLIEILGEEASSGPEGDVNGDGCVDDADLLAVLFAFGNTGSNLPEDVTRDGTVDDADLLVVLFNFGAGC